MAQKPKIGRKFHPHKRWPWVYYTPGHNWPADWAREPFKPSEDSWSLAVCDKKYFRFGCRVFCWCLHDHGMFMHILFAFRWRHHTLGADQTSQFRGSKFFLYSKPVVPKLVRAVTQIKVAIMFYYPQYFAVITHDTEQHCGFGSASPREELHISPGG